MDITQVHTPETLMAWYTLVGWITVVGEICLTFLITAVVLMYFEYNKGV